jgi:hypothetical protein
MWLAVHGMVLLDLGGYLVPPYDASLCFETQLVSLMIGAGDDPVSAGTSVTVSGARFAAAFADGMDGGVDPGLNGGGPNGGGPNGGPGQAT